jgi:4-hydroxybenzoate polyprenyltransferase
MECVASRKIVIFIYTWPALICLFIASRWMVSVPEVLLLVSAVSLTGFAVYFYNDIKDLEDDIKAAELGNQVKSLKPLGQGKVSKDLLTKFTALSAALGLLLASLLNIGVLVSLSLYIVLGILYSTEPFRFKKRFIFKQLIIAFGCVLSILAGAFAGGEISPLVIFMVLMDFALVIGVNPIMDIPDLLGDKAMGAKTIPVVIGPSMTVRFAIAMLAGVAGGTIIGYLGLGFSIALPVLMTLTAGATIYTIIPLMRRYDDIAFTNILLFKRTVPLYLMMQLVPLAGILF